MKTRSTTNVWRFRLMLVLFCIWSIPYLAGAGTAPPIPTGPFDANGNRSVPDYYTTANWANSPPLAKFVDTLPGLGSGKANNLNQFLPVAVPDTTTYPGSDYYIIELREYSEKMHSDLNPTKLRGYVQVDAAGIDVAPIHYLGPIIVAERDRPVRVKFTNRLPAGAAGDLFIPVDTTVMGAGTGPASLGAARGQGAPCDNTVDNNTCASYNQNRAAIHLHGGRTPWISDGTPHQWITPVEEITPFTKGVSLQNVPDMPDPGDGSTTYYFTNQQSARLMFYHDHAFGITRLNVYAGEAAGYVIADQYEQDLVTRGLLPADQIPLIIQDKTFVDATLTTKYLYNPATGLFDTPITVPKVRETDPLWNWGSGVPFNGDRPPVTGDLWLPHVYMPAQTLAAGFGGVNPFGRWMYGPWFYPATNIPKGPVANPYYDADCSSPFLAVYVNCTTPGQPTKIPGTPHPSMGMEAFQDSVVVNGTVFPSLTVDPRAYRFRILNAASDRFQNLSFYVADPAQVSPDTRVASPLTEVKMASASTSLALANNWPPLWPVDGRDGGVPDPGTCTGAGATLACPNLGPSFLQIGTEGGFLPQPVTIAPQPVTYMTDPTAFWVGNVDKMGLALGPAERADVVVDFSAYAGKTLILYNDAPAAWPARVAGYDYYTGAPDMRDSGGYGTGGTWDQITGSWVGGTGSLAGYAPNTRTVMQVIVRATAGTDPAYTFNQSALAAEFTTAATPTAINPAPVKTLFERAQEPIIVGQTAYRTAYPNSYFPINFPWEGVNQINDHFLNFVTLAGQPVNMPTEPKGIHDEMGASFDPVHGRMSGNLGMQLPNPTTLNALLVLYGFSDIPTETVNNSTTVNVQVLGSDPALIPWQVTDGTQIWKISHNGVDTHPIHFHIFDVQLINRVGWDGQILLPEPNELGWKDTIKISPLEDTIVAVRPRAPALPFGIPNSLRPLNPSIPIDSPMGFNSVDWQTGQARVPAVTNILYNFGWEYVWHCHILSHEEMDMMRPIVLNVVSTVPAAPVLSASSLLPAQVDLSWTDPTPVNYVTGAGFGDPKGEIGFRIERAVGNGPFSVLGTVLANSTTFSDLTVAANTMYRYQVTVYNASGQSTSNMVTLGPLDITPPTVSAVVSPAPNAAGWSSGATTVTLTATDPVDPLKPWLTSGVASITYSINGGANVTEPGSTITLPSTMFPEGLSVITFLATDQAATPNVSATQTLNVNVDRTLPTLTWGVKTPAANASGWNNTTVNIPYTTADNLSGVASSTPISPITFAAQGNNQTQVVTVTDVAGNSALFTSPAVSIDLIPPAVTATAVPATANRGGGTSTIRVSGTITDALSRPVATGTWRLTDSKSATAVTGTFPINGTTGAYTFQTNISRSNTGNTGRIYTFTVTATDNADNTSTATTTFTVR